MSGAHMARPRLVPVNEYSASRSRVNMDLFEKLQTGPESQVSLMISGCDADQLEEEQVTELKPKVEEDMKENIILGKKCSLQDSLESIPFLTFQNYYQDFDIPSLKFDEDLDDIDEVIKREWNCHDAGVGCPGDAVVHVLGPRGDALDATTMDTQSERRGPAKTQSNKKRASKRPSSEGGRGPQKPQTRPSAFIECDLCKKRLKSPETLRRHKRIHDEHARYKCDFCGKTTNQRNNLTKHVKAIHGVGLDGKPRTLVNCDFPGCVSYKNFREDKLREHMRRKHRGFESQQLHCGKKLNSSAKCKYFCYSSSRLEEHRATTKHLREVIRK